MTEPVPDEQWPDAEIETRRNDLGVYVPVIPGIDPNVSQEADLFPLDDDEEA